MAKKISRKYNDVSDDCNSCPLWPTLKDHYNAEGIEGLYDEVSEKIYDTCDKCKPGVKEKFECIRDLFLLAEKAEHQDGRNAGIGVIQGFLEFIGPGGNHDYLIGFYEELVDSKKTI